MRCQWAGNRTGVLLSKAERPWSLLADATVPILLSATKTEDHCAVVQRYNASAEAAEKDVCLARLGWLDVVFPVAWTSLTQPHSLDWTYRFIIPFPFAHVVHANVYFDIVP